MVVGVTCLLLLRWPLAEASSVRAQCGAYTGRDAQTLLTSLLNGYEDAQVKSR